jgi:hypothetical protein
VPRMAGLGSYTLVPAFASPIRHYGANSPSRLS